MKKIGDISLEVDDKDHLINADYAGGIIVQLTKREAYSLRLLQECIDGKKWDWESFQHNYYVESRERDESHTFDIIRMFVEMKFHVNSSRDLIEKMDNYLMCLENDVPRD
jgi:hypothetical protein